MCLSRVDKVYDPPLAEERTAWKVFIRPRERLEFLCQLFHRRWEVPYDKWLSAERVPVSATTGETYKAGFHAFADRLIARRLIHENGLYGCVILSVTLRGIRTVGVEEDGTVLVADEMYVPLPQAEPTTEAK